ncbi:hypothetical protein ID866_12256 [Astraeus odoratus]|nr:hypothetical protein ID866_12256 [Astraeus odoratus]
MDVLGLRELWDGYGVVTEVTPFTTEFPHADIHQLIAPDLLHQLIKGMFKDHLMTWVGKYLELVHGKQQAGRIIADID